MYERIMFPDISHWKPVTDWNAAKKKYPLLISKATQGRSYVDPTLRGFIKGCEENEIPYWLYSFVTNRAELDSAKFLVQTCRPLVGKMFQGYMLDIEKNPSDNTYPTAAGTIDALKYLQTQSKRTLIYTGWADYSRYKSVITTRGKNCAWIEARYGADDNNDHCKTHPIHDGVDVHQFSSQYRDANDGITDRGDMNHTTGTFAPEWFTGKENERKLGAGSVAKVMIDQINIMSSNNNGRKRIGWLTKGAKVRILEVGPKEKMARIGEGMWIYVKHLEMVKK